MLILFNWLYSAQEVNMKRPTVKQAIDAAGDVKQLANDLGYTKARVYQWLSEGRRYLPELAEYRRRYGDVPKD